MNALLSFLVIHGVEDLDWISTVVDPIEWTYPDYYHQN